MSQNNAISRKTKSEHAIATPFTELVANNPEATGVLSGFAAMKAAGVQSSFVQANLAIVVATGAIGILRAGAPPRHISGTESKPSTVKSKSSNQGFARGVIPVNPVFNRLDEYNNPIPHAEKDTYHLGLPIDNWNYQHTLQLEISMQDIIERTAKGSDLFILGYNEKTGLLRLAYREGKGPRGFNGQYVISLKEGNNTPHFVSRAWDKPENDPNWDPKQQIIRKPAKLDKILDELYKKIFNQTFKVSYSAKKGPIQDTAEIKPFKVFASKPNTAEEFKAALGTHHPQYARIAKMNNLMQILKTLDKKVIREVYDRHAKVIAGDWDGLALGYSPSLEKKYREVLNTFDLNAVENQQQKLLRLSEEYFHTLKTQVLKKERAKQELTDFERMVKSVSSINDIISPVAIARAGCITPYEFTFISLTNHASNDPLNSHYGAKYDTHAAQEVLNRLLHLHHSARLTKGVDIEALAKKSLQLRLTPENQLSENMLGHVATHISVHFRAAIMQGKLHYQLPNIEHDVIKNLYQHGFENRNPSKQLNLEGRWIMFLPDGGVLWGENQKQLIATLLSSNGALLKSNCIDVNPASDMAIGWGRIVEKQLELGQKIPPATLENYKKYKKQQAVCDKENTSAEQFVPIKPYLKSRTPLFFHRPQAQEEQVELLLQRQLVC